MAGFVSAGGREAAGSPRNHDVSGGGSQFNSGEDGRGGGSIKFKDAVKVVIRICRSPSRPADREKSLGREIKKSSF